MPRLLREPTDRHGATIPDGERLQNTNSVGFGKEIKNAAIRALPMMRETQPIGKECTTEKQRSGYKIKKLKEY